MSEHQVATARNDFDAKVSAVRAMWVVAYPNDSTFDEMVEAAQEYASAQYSEGVSVGQCCATGGF